MIIEGYGMEIRIEGKPQEGTFKISNGQYNYTIDGINFAKIFDHDKVRPDYWINWPILYILLQEQEALEKKKNGADKLQAYIGQTTNGLRRMAQHLQSGTKQELEDIHFIYSSEFNQSVTFDYESKLIQMFAADGKYFLLNGNGGLSDKNYYNKAYYDEGFATLWEGLLQQDIVKHSLEQIRNSIYSNIRRINR